MIRYRRLPEPERLSRQRRWRLARLKLDWLDWIEGGGNANDPDAVRSFVDQRANLIDHGYDDPTHEVRVALRRGNNLKCVWCEGEINRSEPLDHFRPRRRHQPQREGVDRDPLVHHDGYWWLTWCFDNLLPTCATCHGPKGSKFPLAAGGIRCQPFELPDDATERPLLIDPSREDPAALIEYVAVEGDSALASPRRLHATDDVELPRFVPRAIVDDQRVDETLKLTGLRSRKLDDNWEKHLRVIQQYDLVPLRRAIASGDTHEGIRAKWNKLVQRYIRDPKANRRALTRAFLDHHFPHDERAALGLSLPSLQDPGPAEARLTLFEPTRLRARDERLALAIEACDSDQASDLERAMDIFTRAGETPEALADALEISLATLHQRLGLP